MQKLKVCIVKRDPQSFFLQAMEGFKKAGDAARILPTPAGDADVYCMWGTRRRPDLSRVLRTGKRVVIMERGYLGDRFHWTSFGYDGLNGRADFCNANVPDDRAQFWIPKMKPWRDGGEYALVIGQVPGDMSLGDLNLGRWITETLKQALKKYPKVVYRPHPLAGFKQLLADIPPSVEIHKGVGIEQSLAGAICCITFSSNSAVDAVMEGVPVVTQGACSMASAISTKTVNDPLVFPDRSDWLRRIAYTQWTPEEVEAGKFWSHLRPGAKVR